MILQRPLLFFDLETTGTETAKDRIVQIGMVKVHPNGKRESKEWLVNPGIAIPVEASTVHGIYDADVKDKPLFEEIALDVLSLLRDCDIAGFNSNRFDVPLLFAEFHRAGVTWDYSEHHFVDVYSIYIKNNERTLTEAYKQYIGGEFEAHNAIADVEATIAVFDAMVRTHEDIPLTMDALDKYCMHDKKRADLSGKFYYEGEDLYFNFGPKKDSKVKDEMGFITWMLTKDFPADVVLFCKKIQEQYRNKTL